MSAEHQDNSYSSSLGLNHTPIGTMLFKVRDLGRDVDCLKATYDNSVDPNKSRIGKVLSNMKKKLHKADQMLKFGQIVTDYSVSEQRRVADVLRRIQHLKELVKDLLKGHKSMSTKERRSVCQMFHQLLSMEKDVIHFAEPENGGSLGKCRSIEEAHWKGGTDCETVFSMELRLKQPIQPEDEQNERIVCCSYPEIEEPSDCGEEETRGTVFSIRDHRKNTDSL